MDHLEIVGNSSFSSASCLVVDMNRKITTLPEEMIAEIFQYLSLSDLMQMGKVCRRWANTSRDPRLVLQAIQNLGVFKYAINEPKLKTAICGDQIVIADADGLQCSSYLNGIENIKHDYNRLNGYSIKNPLAIGVDGNRAYVLFEKKLAVYYLNKASPEIIVSHPSKVKKVCRSSNGNGIAYVLLGSDGDKVVAYKGGRRCEKNLKGDVVFLQMQPNFVFAVTQQKSTKPTKETLERETYTCKLHVYDWSQEEFTTTVLGEKPRGFSSFGSLFAIRYSSFIDIHNQEDCIIHKIFYDMPESDSKVQIDHLLLTNNMVTTWSVCEKSRETVIKSWRISTKEEMPVIKIEGGLKQCACWKNILAVLQPEGFIKFYDLFRRTEMAALDIQSLSYGTDPRMTFEGNGYLTLRTDKSVFTWHFE